MEAFEQVMRNFYEEMPGSWSVPGLIPIIWTQYLLHQEMMEGWLAKELGNESAGGRPSSLTIWTFNEDRAVAVTNTLAPPVEVIESANGKYEIRSSLIESRYTRKKPTEKEVQALTLPLKRIPSDRYLLFEPLSGLYQTDEKFTEELNKIEDTFARMEKLILAFEPNAKNLKLYATSRAAERILNGFSVQARLMSPNPKGKEKCI